MKDLLKPIKNSFEIWFIAFDLHPHLCSFRYMYYKYSATSSSSIHLIAKQNSVDILLSILDVCFRVEEKTNKQIKKPHLNTSKWVSVSVEPYLENRIWHLSSIRISWVINTWNIYFISFDVVAFSTGLSK